MQFRSDNPYRLCAYGLGRWSTDVEKPREEMHNQERHIFALCINEMLLKRQMNIKRYDKYLGIKTHFKLWN